MRKPELRAAMFATCVAIALAAITAYGDVVELNAVGGLCLRGGASYGIAVRGQYGYMAVQDAHTGRDYLSIVDISSPSRPIQVDTRSGTGGWYSVVSGDYLYLPSAIFDITEASAPTRVGPGLGGSFLAVSAPRAITAQYNDKRVSLWDVTDPGSPLLTSAYDAFGSCADGVAVSGPYAYIASRSDHSVNFEVVDISDPSHPIRVGLWATSAPYMEGCGVAVSGSQAYVVFKAQPSGLYVIDISNPSAPSKVGYLELQSAQVATRHAVLAISGSQLHIPCYTTGIQVVDISNPTNPSLVSVIGTTTRVNQMVATGSYDYLAAHPSDPLPGGLEVLDVSDPANARVVGTSVPLPSRPTSMTVSGSYAFMTDTYRGLDIGNVSDPSNPFRVASFGEAQGAQDVEASGGLVLIPALSPTSAASTRLYAVDVSNPLVPNALGSCTVQGRPRGLAAGADYAFVASGEGGLRVVSLADPASLAEVASCPIDGGAADAAIRGQYAFVAAGERGLRVVDISSPLDPSEVASCPIQGSAYGVTVSDQYAYVASVGAGPETPGLSVVDITVPLTPAVVGFHGLSDSAYRVAISGEYAYVAARTAGLRVLDVANPSEIVEVGSFGTPGYAQDVTVDGDYVYLTDGAWGWLILQATLGPPHVEFPDVSVDSWAFNEVEACVRAAIVSGYDDGLYHPEWTVTRDQMAVYISRALAGGDSNVPDFTDTPTFPDVPDTFWALKYVEYAVDQSIITGYEDGEYHPEYQVNRAQMAVYVTRAMVAPTGETALADYVPADPRNFPDVASDFWAYKHIEYCVENGVVGGYEDGLYHPEIVVTRDQMAVYIARAFELL